MVHDPRSRSSVVCVLGVATHLVEFDPERVGDHPHGLAQDARAVRGHRLQVGVVDRLAEADRPRITVVGTGSIPIEASE